MKYKIPMKTIFDLAKRSIDMNPLKLQDFQTTFHIIKQIYQEQTKWMVPNVIGYAWLPLLINFFLPGFGTFYAVLNQKNDSRLLNLFFALIQLMTWLILFGWCFGVVWGLAIYERSTRDLIHVKEEMVRTKDFVEK